MYFKLEKEIHTCLHLFWICSLIMKSVYTVAENRIFNICLFFCSTSGWTVAKNISDGAHLVVLKSLC